MTDLAILYEHPQWFAPLFAALDRRGVDYTAFGADGHWNPADSAIPAPVVLNRIAMSSFLRADEHPIFHTIALLDHWRRSGARVVNGPDVMAIDASKARQLALIASLGLAIPETRIVHRAADVEAAAATLAFPLVVKANIGGSGAGIMRFDNMAELRWAVNEGELPKSVDGVLLVQDYVPARGGEITRIETLDRQYLYAIDIAGGGAFDLCPADACVADSNISMRAAEPSSDLVDAAERIAAAMNLDVGGVEVMIDDRDGLPRFYDINALSNFVAQPLNVLGWDPHERLIDWLDTLIAETR
ncbi:alpha-L-glutamate ligase [Sphingomonas sp.]|jgi:glutathione synthase/RimK-type ligase-like ATP-grasp enzyme|uniref:ATP-grasp domain-containing protein n=1 Tax=Sphingomonas sp. TaxID=28214 RepID=UPI002E37FA62|nr:alpha-L-glutamate ligase [Sphingomonas sp.]HEX4694708.1 alpha-L-glutamate ligase [Sphingomonas sp.]